MRLVSGVSIIPYIVTIHSITPVIFCGTLRTACILPLRLRRQTSSDLLTVFNCIIPRHLLHRAIRAPCKFRRILPHHPFILRLRYHVFSHIKPPNCHLMQRFLIITPIIRPQHKSAARYPYKAFRHWRFFTPFIFMHPASSGHLSLLSSTPSPSLSGICTRFY
jgi:hypothetical protein